MLCCCSSEDGGEREGERREDVEAESGPAGAADPGVPGPDGGPDPAAGAVGARQGQVHTQTELATCDQSETWTCLPAAEPEGAAVLITFIHTD